MHSRSTFHLNNFPHRISRGFTAVELMVVVAIVAVLAALAAPSFLPMIERWRVNQAVEELKSTLYFARSEAIKRGGRIGVQKNPNSGKCTLASTTQEWGCGWFVFIDSNGNNKWDAAEEILQTTPAPTGLAINKNPSGANMNFNSFGAANSINLFSFTFSPDRVGVSSPATTSLCFSSAGIIKTIRDVPPCS